MSREKNSENVSYVIGNISRECYPRYDYTAKYVTRLTRKCNKLITSCNLMPPCDTTVFGYVAMFIETRTNKPILSDDELVYRPIPEGKTIDWKDCGYGLTHDKTASDDNIIHPVVQVYSSNDLKEKEFLGRRDIVVFISDQKSNITLDPSINYVCVSNKKEFAKKLCFVLERFTLAKLRHTFEIVQALSAETTDGILGMHYSSNESDFLKIPSVKEYMPALIKQDNDKQIEVHLTEKQLLTTKIPLAFKEQLEAFSPLLRNYKEVFKQTAWASHKQKCDKPGDLDELDASKVISRLREHLELASSPDIRQKLKDVIAECTTVYLRSKVPEHDKPKLNQIMVITDEKVSSDLFANIPDVVSCGYRLGTFHVYCRKESEDSDNHLQDIIKRVLERNDIFDYVLRFELDEIRKCCNHAVGSQIVFQRSLRGVVGGYATKGVDRKLCGLTAGHVTEPFKQTGNIVQVRDRITNTPLDFGIVLQPGLMTDFSLQPVDISAIGIFDSIVSACERRFKSLNNECVSSNLFPMVNRAMLPGRIVHISRASSDPGLGKVTNADLHDRKSRLVIIEDLDSSDEDDEAEAQASQRRPFAREGDSGSIPCADNPDGDSVDVISILVGLKEDDNEKGKQKYFSFYMEDGFNQLHNEQGEDFTLC